MQQLLDNIKNHMHWVVFLLLEVVSLVLLFRFNPYQQSLWFSKANQLAAASAEQQHRLTSYLNLGEENEALMRQNIILQHRLQQMERQLRKLPTETAMQHVWLTMEQDGMRMISARVSNNSVRQRDNIMLINRGAQDGIRPEMGVLCGTGIVGIVAQVGERYSTVLPVLNSKSSISCRLRGTNYFGYLHWHGGNPLHATLEDVPHHARVKVGDVVETSGFSNVFPAGVFVGRVLNIKNSADGLAYELGIHLGADLSNIEQVTVIENLDKEEMTIE